MLNKLGKKFSYGEQGFTLIELLIVIVILGILAAEAIPQVTKFVGEGKVSASNTELGIVKTAVGAGMADAQASSVTGATTSPTVAVGPTTDCEIASITDGSNTANYYVGRYLQGSTGNTQVVDGNGGTAAATLPIVGTYAISDTGVVTGISYPGGPTWDTTNNDWQQSRCIISD
jgi:prepilin-type N-terminal cleavage/methylation domain-containing protein